MGREGDTPAAPPPQYNGGGSQPNNSRVAGGARDIDAGSARTQLSDTSDEQPGG